MSLTTKTLCTAAGTLLLAHAAPADITFGSGVTYSTPARPDGIAHGDFNGDGFIDLAIATDTPDKVSILRNNGNGTFAAPVNIPTGGGTGPNFVRAADIDGDGDTDLIVALHNSNQIMILTNNGLGAFTPAGTFAVGADPRWISVTRLDANATMDIMVSNRAGNSLTVLLNTGGLTFSSTTYPVGADPRTTVVIDLNNDTRPDILVSDHDDRNISILQNDGTGHFTAAGTVSVGTELRPVGMTVMDVNNDGHPDLVAATSGNGRNFASVFINTAGVLTGPTNYPTLGVNPGHIANADLDHDGDADLIVVNEDSANISVLGNNGNGTFAAAILFAVGTNPQAIAINDFDRNGMADIAVTNQGSDTTTVLMNAGTLPGQPCYANCDSSTAAPILNANDFQCFLNKYAAGEAAANCDLSTAAPILNANDFQCFLNKYAAGCP
jgi:hypothetical protein